MSERLSRDQVERLVETYVAFRNTGDSGGLEALVDDGIADEPTVAGLVQMDGMVRTAFPDWHMEPGDVWYDEVAQAGLFHYEASGTFEGEWCPMNELEGYRFAPTGESFRFSGVQLFRFEDGRLVDTSGYKDSITFATQAGILPEMTELASAVSQ